MRYPSAGDWFWSDDGEILNIRVSRLGSAKYEFCLGLHELVEAFMCWRQEVPQEAVDEFDMPYEAAHAAGATHYPCGCARTKFSDPGSDIHAPYHWQHMLADVVERTVALALCVNWQEYDALVDSPPR